MFTQNGLGWFELISVPHSRHASAERFAGLRQVNADLHLIHTVTGAGGMQIHGRRYRTDPTCVMCVPAGVECLYDKRPGEPWEMINLHVRIGNHAGPLPLGLPTRFQPADLPAVHTRLRRLDRLAVAARGSPLDSSRALLLAHQIVAGYFAAFGVPVEKPTAVDPLVEQARGLIEAAATRPLEVARLAAELGLSRSQLGRRFRAQTGLSVKQYWNRSRLSLARQALLDPRVGVGQVAQRLGFLDVFYFSRWFTGKAGQSPTAFRRSGHAARL